MDIRLFKKTVCVLFSVCFLFFLSACGDKVKNEAEMISDLQAYKGFVSEDIKISNLEVVKRQTNTDKNSDEVYVTVYTDDERFTSTLSLVLRYELYNEGWMLESINRTKGVWEFYGLSDEQLLDDIRNTDPNFSAWQLEILNHEITGEQYNSNASTLYEKMVCVDLVAYEYYFDYKASYNVWYEVENGEWVFKDASIEESRMVPTYAPNISASDRIFEELEIADGVTYDSYQYLRTEENWEDCFEIRYYEATIDNLYGTETFLVEIPLFFSIEGGEPEWSYSPNEIVHTLQGVDWNIEGEWTCDYSAGSTDGWGAALNSYAVAKLRIYDIEATDAPGEYRATVYFNGYSDFYDFQFVTEEKETATLKLSSTHLGIWTLMIDGAEELGTYYQKYGWVTFYGYGADRDREGAYWNCTTDGVKMHRA